jgi:YggT family protein
MAEGLAQFLYLILSGLLSALSWILIIAVISSLLVSFNVINLGNDFVRQVYYALQRILDLVCAPVRRIMPDLGGIDLSPVVVLIVLGAVQRALLPAIFSSLIG